MPNSQCSFCLGLFLVLPSLTEKSIHNFAEKGNKNHNITELCRGPHERPHLWYLWSISHWIWIYWSILNLFKSISHVHHIFMHLPLLSYVTLQLSKLPTFRRKRPSKEWRSLVKRTAFNWVHSVPSIREGFTRIEDFAHCTYCLTKLMLIRMIDWRAPAVRSESNITLPHAFASAFVCITPGSKQNRGMMHRNEEIKSGPSLPKQGCNAGGHRHGMPMLLATYQLRPWENSPQKQQLRRSVQCDGNATCLEFTGTVWIARLKATKCCVYTGLLQIETSDSAH